MDDVPEGEDDVTRTDTPVVRADTSGPTTDRVRIVGAEPAGEITGELPVVPRQPADGDSEGEPVDLTGTGPGAPGHSEDPSDRPLVRLTGEPGDPGPSVAVVSPLAPGETAVPSGTPAATELPHWTEPPTGQVPAVLARDVEGGEGTAIVPPTWREEDADWTAHDEEFEPAMFRDDEVALGSLDETDDTDVERRPWEFDLDGATSHPITEPTEPVTVASEESTPGDTGRPAAAAGQGAEPGPAVGPAVVLAAAAGEPPKPASRPRGEPTIRPVPVTDDPVPSVPSVPSVPAGHAADPELLDDGDPALEPARPTGSTRLGRARRAGLLPARMRAKRPDDADAITDAPLAAEPPGASVTEVPGAGRKRGGVAGLAAADRIAERESDLAVGDGGGSGPESVSAGVGAPAVPSPGGAARRRSLRRSPSDHRQDAAASAVAGAAPVAAAGGAAGLEATGGGPPAPRQPRRRPLRPEADGGAPRAGSTTGVRVGTGIAVAVIALLAFKLGTVPSLILSLVVVTFAAGECFGVLRRAGYHPATLLGLVGTISLMVGAYDKGVAALPLVLVLITAFTLIWYLFGIERGSPVAGTAATMLTVGWVSLLGAYAGLLLSPSTFPDRHGIAFLLGAIIATVANDVGALVVGGWLGSRPLAPTISPNKTWEGLFGGAVFSIGISTVVVGSIHPWSASNAALLGVVVAVVAPIGDLCESLLKRDLRLKDMGTLLPGHGGVLDRVDALLFVLPATYYLVRALNIA